MFQRIKNIFLEKERKLIHRKFEPKCFNNNAHQLEFEKNGYIVLKNCLTIEDLNALNDIHEKAKLHNSYERKEDKYYGSFSFSDVNIRNFIRSKTISTLDSFSDKFINRNNFSYPLGGGFCVNPAHSIVGCYPHQDPSAVNEKVSYSLSMWIALTDMNEQRGCLYVIPGSHLWGNFYRSINIKWKFNNYLNLMWQLLKPVPLNKGDILFFDLSTIHASVKNITDNERIGLNIPLLPKNLQKYCYYPIRDNFLSTIIDEYEIDVDYFLSEDETKPPSEKHKYIQRFKYNNYFSEKNIMNLNYEFSKSII